MKKGNKGIITIIVVAVLGVGLLGFNRFFGGSPAPDSGNDGDENGNSREVPCVNSVLPLVKHTHSQLKIIVNGSEVMVPDNTGLSAACHKVLHTHDGEPGKIHLESNTTKDYTLGDFFAVWAKPFSRTQILNYVVDESHELVLMVNSQPSREFENLVFKDGQNIVIEYREAESKK